MGLRAVARGAPGTLYRRIITVADPGAGVDVSVPVPPHKAWHLLGVASVLTASAAAGNRFPKLTLLDAGGVTLGAIASPTAITANLAPSVSWLPGTGAAVVVAASYATLTLPGEWYMQPGESLTLSGHTDAGDAWSAIRVTVLETDTGDPAYIGSLEQRIADHLEALRELLDH